MNDHFGWLLYPADDDLVLSDFNVDVSRPDDNWLPLVMLDRLHRSQGAYYHEALVFGLSPTTCPSSTELPLRIQGLDEKVSLFCLPANPELRDRWKRAIPRQETAGFSFESKYFHVCEKHFDVGDIIRAEVCTVNGNVVSLPRDRPKLVEGAIPRIFQGVLVYLSKPKERSHAPTRRPPAKRRRVVSSNCAEAEVAAVATADVTDPAEEETHDEVRTVNRLGGADAECLTEHAACFASELQRVKAQLRSVKQQLHSCQRKLAKVEAQVNEKRGMQETIQKLSGREMLIIDQPISSGQKWLLAGCVDRMAGGVHRLLVAGSVV
ncbi:uncharacterized protein LOC125946373 [Dermacentor silvarum]|uniref:uncharacterized protein LOC125946373 n=1 Tax=Dermacentor silvarum TaxID=543639 RepID=UPI002101C917|nr:uncharacterized protein LOC125946373 [Dermacentor silvarum]